jgi:hypothetical protein
MIKFLLYCFLIINNLDKYFEDEGRVFKITKRSVCRYNSFKKWSLIQNVYVYVHKCIIVYVYKSFLKD